MPFACADLPIRELISEHGYLLFEQHCDEPIGKGQSGSWWFNAEVHRLCVVDARAPEWVGNDLADGDGPLTVDEVKLTDAGEAALRAAWERRRKDSLYESADEFVAFVTQALGRDIRSYHQRLGDVAPDTDWRVSLDGVIVVYRQSAKRVVVVGAEN